MLKKSDIDWIPKIKIQNHKWEKNKEKHYFYAKNVKVYIFDI